MRLMRELRKNQKKKGMLALEAAMALLMVVMASYGVAATSAMEFSQMAASKTAKQAEQYAELEADYLRMVGFYHFDDGSTVYNEPHGRQNMRKIVGDEYGSEWESKVTHVNDITVDKFTSVKVARIDVYKTGDGDVPRFTLEVPLTSSSGDVPIGGIITWPSGTLPDWFNTEQYLECNGQSFNTSEYPHLAELYPDGRVPNYSGLFLRGYGSQNVADDKERTLWTENGSFDDFYTVSSITHSSADTVGGIQYDSVRACRGYIGHQQFAENVYPVTANADIPGNVFHFWPANDAPTAGLSSFPFLSAPNDSDGLNDLAIHGLPTSDFSESGDWYNALTKYKYTLDYSVSTDEDGNQVIDNINLVEEEIHPELGFWNTHADLYYDIDINMPTSNEIRPVNVAVRYFIRAR